MPNKPYRHKRSGTRFSATRRAKRAPQMDSVKDVLAQLVPSLTRVADQTDRQTYWRAWLTEHLGAELLVRISGIVERDGALVIFATSAAWSARLRYAIQELEPAIRASQPDVAKVVVRVFP